MNSSDLAGRYSLLRTHVMHEVSDSSPAPEASGQFVHFADSPFELFQPYPPAGDQPAAIEKLVEGIQDGESFQTLLGVTGSGKTFTMANVIARLGRPAIVFAPNKTLAAQLYSEFREFFPKNSVEYFVSYYDYYQPEAYVPQRDLFIEKDSAINEHIEQMRLSCTKSLMERRDVVIVATVSAIYGIGEPESYHRMIMTLRTGDRIDRKSTRLNSSHLVISYAVFCLKKKKITTNSISFAMIIMDFLVSEVYKLMSVVIRARQIGHIVVINLNPLSVVVPKVIYSSAHI